MIHSAPLPDKHERKTANAHFASRAISWIKVSKPGAETLYHRGFLLLDRITDPALDAEAKAYYLASQAGYAELKQQYLRSLGPMNYAYLATRTAKRMTAGREELFRIKLLEEDNGQISSD